MVDRRFKEDIKSDVAICLSNPPVVETKFGEEIKSDVAICVWRPPVVETSLPWIPVDVDRRAKLVRRAVPGLLSGKADVTGL